MMFDPLPPGPWTPADAAPPPPAVSPALLPRPLTAARLAGDVLAVFTLAAVVWLWFFAL